MSITSGFELKGRFIRCGTDKATLIEALRVLGRAYPSILDKLVEEFDRPGRKRHQVARQAEDVHGKRHDWDEEITEFLPGYFVGTNENGDTKLSILLYACRFAGLQYGVDFRVPCLEGDGRQLRRLQRQFAALDQIAREHPELTALLT